MRLEKSRNISIKRNLSNGWVQNAFDLPTDNFLRNFLVKHSIKVGGATENRTWLASFSNDWVTWIHFCPHTVWAEHSNQFWDTLIMYFFLVAYNDDIYPLWIIHFDHKPYEYKLEQPVLWLADRLNWMVTSSTHYA